MPVLDDFGQKTNADKGSLFVHLKSKGEKLHFRFICPLSYDGKHFSEENGKWTATDCPAIMSEEFCETCDKHRKLVAEAKREKDKNVQAKLMREAGNFKVKTTFYYAIIDRADETAKILQAPLSIRIKVDKEKEMGIEIPKFDYIMERTEEQGNNYYALTRLDSSMAKPLTEKEKFQMTKVDELKEMLGDKKESTQEIETSTDEPATISVDDKGEVVNPEDIPF